MVDFEITKTKKLLEVNNDMCHNYYYLFYGKIYNKEKTHFRRFKIVEWTDIFEVMEYFEKDFVTEKDVKELLTERVCFHCELVKDFNDEKSLKEFYEHMRTSIENYNKIVAYR